MRPLLVILNPREIPEVMVALRALTIPKVWISFYREDIAVGQRLPEVIAAAKEKGYTHIVLVSDDGLVTQETLDRVLAFPPEVRACSGWVNLDAHRISSNISQIELHWYNQPTDPGQYYLIPEETMRGLTEPFKATFSGFALLRMPVETWEEVALQNCSWTSCTDFYTYMRLSEMGVELWVDPKAFFFHLKKLPNEPYSNFMYVGMKDPRILWEEEPGEQRIAV